MLPTQQTAMAHILEKGNNFCKGYFTTRFPKLLPPTNSLATIMRFTANKTKLNSPRCSAPNHLEISTTVSAAMIALLNCNTKALMGWLRFIFSGYPGNRLKHLNENTIANFAYQQELIFSR